MRFACLVAVLVLFLALPAFTAEWVDEFDGAALGAEWSRITWRPGEGGTATLEGGRLLINDPDSDFGHLITDGRPLVLREAPGGDFSISALLDTDPPAPSDNYWTGLFIVGEDGDSDTLASNYAFIGLGGEVGAQKTILASMVDGTFAGKGQFQVPGWPIYLKLEKIGADYTGYYKENADDEWTMLGDTWTHDMGDPELTGFGVLNNWGGAPNLVLTAEYFAMEGENVVIAAVNSEDKLPSTWGQIKYSY